MKNLFIFGAMALTVGMFMYSCEKEEIKSDEKTAQKSDVTGKAGNANPNANAVGFFELDLPDEIRDFVFVKDEDLLDYEEFKHLIETDEFTNTAEVEVENKKGELVSGEIRVTYNTTRGQIQKIEAGESLRREAGINEGYLTRLSRDPNIDIIDIIEPASPQAACQMACQDSYRKNVFECPPSDEFCRKTEWKMYRKCVRGCYIRALRNIFRN